MSSAKIWDYPIWHVAGLRTRSGDIGLEIEVEGTNLPGVPRIDGTFAGNRPSGWNVTTDGSLRNLRETDQSCEYVLSNPVPKDKLPDVLKSFSETFSKAGATSYDTYRTSVHVHLNVGSWPIRKLWCLLTAYFILEDALTNFADGGTKYRVGNRFCLRATDAESIVQRLHNMAREGFRNFTFRRDDWKYGAVNLWATTNYGSIEFRALRGTTDTKLINEWIELLWSVYEYAQKFDDPTYIINEFSELSPRVWAERVLGRSGYQAVETFNPNFEQSMVFGVRLAQDVAYGCDWGPSVEPKLMKSKPVEEPIPTQLEDVVNNALRFRIPAAGNTNYGVRL